MKNVRQTKKDSKHTMPGNRYYNLLALALIVILGTIIYSNSFSCSFHFDDLFHIVNNPRIKNLWDIKTWWSHSPNRPVAIFTLALNYHISQLDVWSWHLFNLAIHLIASCLVYWLALLIFSTPFLKDKKPAAYKKEIALLTALLFVAHPLATQSVTYIIQRMTSMVAMFYFLSLALYIKGRITEKGTLPKVLLFAGSFLSAVLAMLTKENAFTLPFAILLVEFFFIRTEKVKINFRDYRVILLLAAFLAVMLIIPLKLSLSIFNPITPTLGHTYTITPVNYLLTQFSVIVKYIQLLFFPLNQHLDYDYPIASSFFEIRPMLGFLVLAGLIFAGVWFFKRNRILSFGIFWFFLTLSIESSFIPITDVIFEHRTYLPSFGVFLAVAAVAWVPLLERSRTVAYSVAVVIVLVLSVLAFERNKVWKDDITLWTDNAEKEPGYARGLNNLGYALSQSNEFEKAVEYCSRAIEAYPGFAVAYTNRGIAYSNLNQVDKALADLSTSIALDSTNDQVYYRRGLIYASLKQYDKAIADYTKSVQLNPGYNQAYYDRAVLYGNTGDLDKAIEDYTKTIEVNPGFIYAYNNRGAIYRRLGKFDQAIADYTTAININPGYFKSFFNRGNAYAITQEWDKAIADYTKVIALDPGNAEAYTNRAVAYGNLKQWDLAADDYGRVISIQPNNVKAYLDRGIAHGNMGAWEKALEDFNSVLRFDPNMAAASQYRAIAIRNLKR